MGQRFWHGVPYLSDPVERSRGGVACNGCKVC